VVVFDRHVFRTRRGGGPFEAHPPLIVDPDTAGIIPCAFQLLEMMAREFGDVTKYSRGIQSVQSGFRLLSEWLELPDALAAGKTRRTIVAIASDHSTIYRDLWITSIINHAQCEGDPPITVAAAPNSPSELSACDHLR
jgi:hypothetical protein